MVEPLISTQWFVKMKPLAERAIEVVETKRIEFIPENWTKTYFEWMYNIRDWCVSRQLWWGHRIPAWHCGNCQEIMVAREVPSNCARCGSQELTQDPDVLDTWFSSRVVAVFNTGLARSDRGPAGLLSDHAADHGLRHHFFWVARMIVMGLECTGKIPFRQVYIHGLVRDADRQKMSKTKGNVIDPLEVTIKYGTDAVRLALLMGAAPGTDIVLAESRMEATRNFANKIWNAARFLFSNMERSGVEPWAPDSNEPYRPEADAETLEIPIEDRWIFSRLNSCAEQANNAIEQYRFHEAAQVVWQFFWHEFCDWYVELKKPRFQENTGLNAHWRNALAAFETALRLLHPIMPFLTEELWQRLKLRSSRAAEVNCACALSALPAFGYGSDSRASRAGDTGHRRRGPKSARGHEARSEAGAFRRVVSSRRRGRGCGYALGRHRQAGQCHFAGAAERRASGQERGKLH